MTNLPKKTIGRPRNNGPKRIPLTISLTNRQKEYLKAQAKKSDLTVSQLVRRALLPEELLGWE